MKFSYNEMINYFGNLYNEIFREIEIFSPNTFDGTVIKYSDEYMKAYSWLERAGFRLEEVQLMEDYYTEDDFKFFGLEHLMNVRNRIHNYLKNTNMEFSEKIYDYKKYDEIFNLFVKERTEDKNSSVKYNYYDIKLSQQADYDRVLNSLTLSISDIKILKDDIRESKYLNNRHIKKINKIKKELQNLRKEIEDDQ